MELSRTKVGRPVSTRASSTLRLGVVSLLDIVNDTFDDCRETISARDQHLERFVPDDNVYLYADRQALSHVLSALVARAAASTHSGDTIWLAASLVNEEVRIAIRDHGRGMSAEDVAHAFDSRPTLIAAGARDASVDLAGTRRVVELHGGRISAESEGPGLGSTMTVSMPLIGIEAEPRHDEQ